MAAIRGGLEPGVACAAWAAVGTAIGRVSVRPRDAVFVLTRAMETVDDLVGQIGTRVGEQVRFCDECDVKLVRNVDALRPVLSVVGKLFKPNQAMAERFFVEAIEPRLAQWLGAPSQRFVAISMWRKSLIATGELTPVIEKVIVDDAEIDMKEAVFMMLAKIFRLHPLDRETAGRYFAFFVAAFDSDTTLSESLSLAWDWALIAFSTFIRMNMRHLDALEAAEAWHTYMPISCNVEGSEPASALLADFLEMRNGYLLESDVLAEAMWRTLRNRMWENMERETGERMVQLVRQIATESPEPFVAVWQGALFADERHIFAEVLARTGIEQPPAPPPRQQEQMTIEEE
jgi:hypothetical protein